MRAVYLLRALHDAALNRIASAEHLRGAPKAILMTSAGVTGSDRQGDDVVAVGWSNWVPEEVVRGILASVLG